jgi:hypothetical protein
MGNAQQTQQITATQINMLHKYLHPLSALHAIVAALLAMAHPPITAYLATQLIH